MHNLSASWLEKNYGILNISSIEIYKYESIKCDNEWKDICCKTILAKDDIRVIKNADYIISNSAQNFYYQEYNYCGYMIINNNKVIWFFNSFKLPCNKNDTLLQIIGKINERIKYLKINNICDILNRIKWKEITQTEYDERCKLHVYKKPNYKSIDTLFSEKGKYKFIKTIGGSGNCEKGKYQKNIE
jgi:hypothetical protein